MFAIDWFFHKRSFNDVKDLILSADNLLLLGICFFAVLLHWNTIVTNYDDYNYWAVSTKSLFFRNGIEPKHRHVSFYYGDYPLGMQLIQWWFMHLLGSWEERMLFIGNAIFLYSFIAPLFAGIRSRVKILLCFIVTILIPYSAYDFQYRLSPDACMGIVYSLALVFCIRSVREKEDSWFYLIAVGLFCAALTMIKSVGILWAAFVWVLWLLLFFLKNGIKFRYIRSIAVVAAPGFIMWWLWKRACYLLERDTILVSRWKESALVFDQGHIQRASVFGEAITEVPFRTIPVTGVQVSLVLYFVVACIALWFFAYKIVVSTKEKKLYHTVLGFAILSAIVYMIVILYSVLTMFYLETQYENRHLLLHALIMRYWCPCIYSLLVIGVDFFIQYQKICKPDLRRGLLPYIMSIFLLGIHVPIAVRSVNDQVNIQQQSLAMISEYKEVLRDFLEERDKLPDPLNSKVLYCNLDEFPSVWVGFLAEYFYDGTAVMLESIDPDWLWRTIWNLHFTHIYFASDTQTSTMEYSNLVGGEEFLFNTMYKVEDTDVDYVFLIPEGGN